jgi:hypothetical protein
MTLAGWPKDNSYYQSFSFVRLGSARRDYQLRVIKQGLGLLTTQALFVVNL